VHNKGKEMKESKTNEMVVAVEWIDAFGCPAGWEFEDETVTAATTVRSIGYVLSEDDQFVLIAPHISSPGDGRRRQLAGHIAVPRRQIVKMDVISSSQAVSCQAPASVQTRRASLPQPLTTSAVALCQRVRRFFETTFRS
jgi:hypothetical protein